MKKKFENHNAIIQWLRNNFRDNTNNVQFIS